MPRRKGSVVHPDHYEPMLPIDRMIVEGMPPEGTLFAGIYPTGLTARDVYEKIVQKGDFSDTLGRVRSLTLYGLLTPIQIPRASVKGYQRSALGEKWLVKWQREDK